MHLKPDRKKPCGKQGKNVDGGNTDSRQDLYIHGVNLSQILRRQLRGEEEHIVPVKLYVDQQHQTDYGKIHRFRTFQRPDVDLLIMIQDTQKCRIGQPDMRGKKSDPCHMREGKGFRRRIKYRADPPVERRIDRKLLAASSAQNT